MRYRNLTKDQEREVLENKITELEARHRNTIVELTAARAVEAGTPDDSTQHDTSSREVETLEGNLLSIEEALKALHALAAKEIPNRKTRRAEERAAAKA